MALSAVRIHIHHLITPAFFGQDWGRIFITDGVIFPDGFHNHALTVQLERHAFTDQQGGLQRTGLITHPAIERVHTSLRTGTPEQNIERHIKGAGNGICCTGPLCYRIGKDDSFRIENGGQAAVRPGGVDFRKISDIQVTTFQTAQRCDDVKPVRQRVFVPVNVIERPVHLLLILFRRSLCRFTKSRQAEAQVNHASR